MDSGELSDLVSELTKTTLKLGNAASAIADANASSTPAAAAVSSTGNVVNSELDKDKEKEIEKLLKGFERVLGVELTKADKSQEKRDNRRETREENQTKAPRDILKEATPMRMVGMDKQAMQQFGGLFGNLGDTLGEKFKSIKNLFGKKSKDGKKTGKGILGIGLGALGTGALALALAPIVAIVSFFKEIGEQKWFKWMSKKLNLGKILAPMKEFFMGKTKGTGILARISRLFGKLVPHITKAFDIIKKSKITKTAKLIGRGLGKLFLPLTILLGVIDFVKGFMKGNKEAGIIEGIKQGLVGVVEGLVGGLVDLAGNIIGWLLELVGLDNMSGSVKTLLDDGMNIIYDQIGGIVDFVAGIFTFDIEKMKTGMFAMMDGNKNAIGWILDLAVNPIVNFFRDIFGMGGEFKFTEWSGFDKLPNARELFDNAWKSAGAVFTNYMDDHPYMKEKWDALKNGVSNFAGSIKSKWDAFKADPKGALKNMAGKVVEFAGGISAKWDAFRADPAGAFKDLAGKVASGARNIKKNFNEFLEGSGAKEAWDNVAGAVSSGVGKIKDGWDAFLKDPGATWDKLKGKMADGAAWMGQKIDIGKKFASAQWDKLGAIFSGPVNWMKNKFAEGRRKAELEEKRKELVKELKMDKDATTEEISAKLLEREYKGAAIMTTGSSEQKALEAALGGSLKDVSSSKEMMAKIMEKKDATVKAAFDSFISKYTNGGWLQNSYGHNRLVKVGGKAPASAISAKRGGKYGFTWDGKEEGHHYIATYDELSAYLSDHSDTVTRAKDGSKGNVRLSKLGEDKGPTVLAAQKKQYGERTAGKDVLTNLDTVEDPNDPLILAAGKLGLDAEKQVGRTRAGILSSISEVMKKGTLDTSPELKKKIAEWKGSLPGQEPSDVPTPQINELKQLQGPSDVPTPQINELKPGQEPSDVLTPQIKELKQLQEPSDVLTPQIKELKQSQEPLDIPVAQDPHTAAAQTTAAAAQQIANQQATPPEATNPGTNVISTSTANVVNMGTPGVVKATISTGTNNGFGN